MRITEADLAADKSLGDKITLWAKKLSAASKLAGAHVFVVEGPEDLTVRPRRGGPYSRQFFGGEKLRIASVLLERSALKHTVEILIIFAPVDATLIADFATLTMPLDEALEKLVGMREWVDVSLIETPSEVHRKKLDEAIPSVEQVRASENWGAW